MTLRGFTLIELAIVLVVIGLIVGGILVGQEMIRQAQIRAQMTQIEKLNSRVTSFKVKYDCLPGDCGNATTFFGATRQPNKVTNGNGMIEAGEPDNLMVLSWNGECWRGQCEWVNVFDHLCRCEVRRWAASRGRNSDWA